MPDSTDPITGLLEAAVTVHQLFIEYQSAGFTEEQAMRLVLAMVSQKAG